MQCDKRCKRLSKVHTVWHLEKQKGNSIYIYFFYILLLIVMSRYSLYRLQQACLNGKFQCCGLDGGFVLFSFPNVVERIAGTVVLVYAVCSIKFDFRANVVILFGNKRNLVYNQVFRLAKLSFCFVGIGIVTYTILFSIYLNNFCNWNSTESLYSYASNHVVSGTSGIILMCYMLCGAFFADFCGLHMKLMLMLIIYWMSNSEIIALLIPMILGELNQFKNDIFTCLGFGKFSFLKYPDLYSTFSREKEVAYLTVETMLCYLILCSILCYISKRKEFIKGNGTV